ncbi:PREDICTED: agamous-like MADS-box protein AGL80 [Nelumbo nucifera]|uniref:Agamous-like MADS-box protein AGL80 n=2 Tax=Nelumbo nucifera TaxID=4432 RepID=A0A1U8AWQ3_NELNU|nr:PREDICTED: agamous-like MADS-box protein AGL80 [Nelumbo nucifera]DAD38484.1 TPA_asm: hypothetical protein HUJ06_009125 [Nelumbo nucifera]
MARKKVKLALIANESARRTTFKKRKNGLMKKVSELSTLCGVSACAIIYSPYDKQPDVWPSASDAQRVLARFKNLPEMEQSKKKMNQEVFLRQRISKLKEQLKRQEKDNRKHEMTILMYQTLAGKSLNDVLIGDLNDLAWLVDEKLKEIQERIEQLRRTPPRFIAVEESRCGDDTDVQENNKTALEFMAMDALQAQTLPSCWFMEVMNPHEHIMGSGSGGDSIGVVPYDSDATYWSNAFFP